MTARPILFSAPMIRALLDGRKTQTRRLLKIPVHLDGEEADAQHFQGVGPGLAAPMRDNPDHRCGVFPPWSIGDLLWVREAWGHDAPSLDDCRRGHESDGPHGGPIYRATCNEFDHATIAKWRPGIHMPRWASRLTLRVTDVRVMRLLDITEADAAAEGFADGPIGEPMPERFLGNGWTISSPGAWASAAGHFQSTWAALHPDWDGYSSPWVVALTFAVLRANVDTVLAQGQEVPA